MNIGIKDLVCLSHLRWNFVFQRPQHLLTRFARNHRVFFVEEPVWDDGPARMETQSCPESGVQICVPHLQNGTAGGEIALRQRMLLDELLGRNEVSEYAVWYYTPMALDFSRHLKPRAIVFDIMDELSGFKGAPPEMRERERELLQLADVTFTGGQSLFEAKRHSHRNMHCFPSSVDVAHFAQARKPQREPEDQAGIPHPRIGFCGVVDERMDLDLLAGMARLRPDYHFVIIGPVVKIDPRSLPRLANVHYLGGKDYKSLPQYMSGWDAAMLPFAHNDSTRFISPTKTPEYLAAGLPAISTSITDVVRPYGVQKLVRIADTPEQFVEAIDSALAEEAQSVEWRKRVEAALETNSWDRTWKCMAELMTGPVRRKTAGKSAIGISTIDIKPALLAK